MVVVDNIRDFAKYNEEDIRRYLSSGNGKNIFDPDMVDDIIQNFYVRVINSNALVKYDPSIGKFNTYILTILCNMLPYERKRNPSARYTHISSLANPEGGTSRVEDEIDVYDLIYANNDHPEFGIKKKNQPSCVFQQEEDDCTKHMLAFIEFIKKSETNKKKADEMVCFVEHKMQGCLATDIAKMLGVSDNMVKIMKNNLYDKYKRWDKPPKSVSHA